MGLDPLEFKWIDLFLEYRCLTNHNDELGYGKQLVDGKVKYTERPKPKYLRTEEDVGNGFKPTHSLVEATYKLLGEIRNSEHKNKMRDIIINSPSFTDEERKAIIDYCEEDVVLLPSLFRKCREWYRKLLGYDSKTLLEEMELRGRYAAHTAIMESNGYPIDVEKTRNFSKSVDSILEDCQREINSLFPQLKPFKWNTLNQKFRWDQKLTRDWISKNHEVERWMKTDKGELSLSLEAFEKFYSYSHDYPKDILGAQFVRYLKLKQSLYGFSQSKNRKGFWDYFSKVDGRVRAYFNIYGAQSSRSQPGASGFMFLKPAWMRALVIPPEGKAMAGIDYGSQEFFIAGLVTEDQNMIDAYLSGDVYLAFGKQIGMIPKDGTKETHKFQRNLCKAAVLGISFGMTCIGLSAKLTADTGKEVTEEEAQEFIDAFYDAYPNLKEWQDSLEQSYLDGEPIKLPCGWYHWCDNDNMRSVKNVPIQGFGASVMRRAVDIAVKNGCQISFTLHDAIYIEYPIDKPEMVKVLNDAMIEGFAYYFRGRYHELAKKIKLDPFAWSRNYEPDSEIVVGDYKFPASNLYLDDRALNDYQKFSKYFESQDYETLL